jgi:fatty-acyl-CoA synthase
MAFPKVAQTAARSFSSLRHAPDAGFSYVNGASKKPLIGMTLGQAFDYTCAKHGKDRAIVSRQQKIRWDYEEFSGQVNKLAAALLKLGLNKGDR